MTFKTPEIDWAKVQYPIEGKTKSGIRTRLLKFSAASNSLFGETNGRLDGTDRFWYANIWSADENEPGISQDSCRCDDTGDLDLQSFGKLPRKP